MHAVIILRVNSVLPKKSVCVYNCLNLSLSYMSWLMWYAIPVKYEGFKRILP